MNRKLRVDVRGFGILSLSMRRVITRAAMGGLCYPSLPLPVPQQTQVSRICVGDETQSAYMSSMGNIKYLYKCALIFHLSIYPTLQKRRHEKELSVLRSKTYFWNAPVAAHKWPAYDMWAKPRLGEYKPAAVWCSYKAQM